LYSPESLGHTVSHSGYGKQQIFSGWRPALPPCIRSCPAIPGELLSSRIRPCFTCCAVYHSACWVSMHFLRRQPSAGLKAASGWCCALRAQADFRFMRPVWRQSFVAVSLPSVPMVVWYQ